MTVAEVAQESDPPPGSRSFGRPAKDPKDRLSEIINIRVTPAEADSLYRYAIRHGRPLNDVLRTVLRRLIDSKQSSSS